MPVYLDRKTKRLYIEFQYKNTRYKERLAEGTTKEQAKKLELKWKSDLMFERHGIVKGITFNEFIDKYFGPVADGWNKDRRARAVILVKACMPFLSGKGMRDIKAADIERVKAARANLLTQHDTIRKPATIEREMSVISSIFSMAVANDIIDYNPCGRVKRIRFDNEMDKVLRYEDEDAFFANMHSEWARDICKMVLNTALRQNDLMKITRFNVRFNENKIVLTQGKTQFRVTVRLNEVSREILERRWHSKGDLLFASPVTGTKNGSVRHAMIRACKRIDIPPLTIRDLRRTALTRAAENGADAITLAAMAGHRGLRMVQRYVKSDVLLQKAADSLPKLKVVK